MHKEKLMVLNPTGLHARPASDLVRCAKKYEADLQLVKLSSGEKANAKSIVKVLSLAVPCGEEIELVGEGKDAEQAVQALANLIHSRFGE